MLVCWSCSRRALQRSRRALQRSRRALQRSRRALQRSRRALQRSRRALQRSRRTLQRSRRALQRSRRALRRSRRALQRSRRALRRSRRALQRSRRALRRSRRAFYEFLGLIGRAVIEFCRKKHDWIPVYCSLPDRPFQRTLANAIIVSSMNGKMHIHTMVICIQQTKLWIFELKCKNGC